MLRGALPSTKKCSSLLVASGIISAAILGVIPGALLTQGLYYFIFFLGKNVNNFFFFFHFQELLLVLLL